MAATSSSGQDLVIVYMALVNSPTNTLDDQVKSLAQKASNPPLRAEYRRTMCAEVHYWSRCTNYPRCRYLNHEHTVMINCTLGLPVEKPFGQCGYGVNKRNETTDENVCRVECRRCEEEIRDRRIAGYWWSRQRWYQ